MTPQEEGTASDVARGLVVVDPGPLSTVQDEGRPGHAALGVGRSGAADPCSARLANRLLGNDSGAAVVESTLGGLRVRAVGDILVAVTGAPGEVRVGTRGAAMNTPIALPHGAELRLGTPHTGLRGYLAVRGGVTVPPVLGSRSTDTLAELGPAPLHADTWLPAGTPPARFPTVDVAPTGPVGGPRIDLRAVLGPRGDWFGAEALRTLATAEFEVTSRSNRIGMRLAGPALPRERTGELPSEGMVPGSIQVPPDGEPVLFLADHPVTGGYPVIAVVLAADIPRAAQARPGDRVRFRVSDPVSL